MWWALSSPALDVVAVVATAGVVAVDQAARNAAKVLHAAGRPDIPLALGPPGVSSPSTLPRSPAVYGGRTRPSRQGRGGTRHGRDGLGDCGIPDAPLAPVAEPGPELVARLAAAAPGTLTIVTLGPLTTLAAAVAADPGLPGRVADLVCMGGEFNVGADPAAVAAVERAGWPAPPLLVTLDAGLSAALGDEELATLARRATPQAAFLACPVEAYARAARTAAGCPSHDTVAMVACAHPDLVTVEDRPPWRVATAADGDRVRAIVRVFFDPDG